MFSCNKRYYSLHVTETLIKITFKHKVKKDSHMKYEHIASRHWCGLE